jgi:hypothetical protein
MFAKLLAIALAVSGIVTAAPAAPGPGYEQPCKSGSYRCDPTNIAVEICDLYVALSRWKSTANEDTAVAGTSLLCAAAQLARTMRITDSRTAMTGERVAGEGVRCVER